MTTNNATPPDDEDVVFFPDVQVRADHRVTLKPRARAARGDLSPGDAVTAYVFVHDTGDEFIIPGGEIGSEYRITVPEHQREKYGIQSGDYVDIYIEK